MNGLHSAMAVALAASGRFVEDESAVSAIEYALMATLVAVSLFSMCKATGGGSIAGCFDGLTAVAL